ncbi:MAG: hypothetical protein ACI8W7_005009 [Gammaproteobacteria bacterium]|jgi:hypothetical protein
MADLDRRGIPGVMVASEQFRNAARAQADAIGFEPAIVWVPHPIQNRSRDELRAIAADAIDEIIAQLTMQ